jgi:hypothetical protein
VIVLNISEVAVFYAARVPDLRQQGQRWRGRCPIHRGKHNSFSVDPVTGLWRCWSDCGRGGDIIALEIALTGATWREAVASVEHTIGRILLDRVANRAERRILAERRELLAREMREAEFFRVAAETIGEQVLEELPEAAPERFAQTQLLLCLRGARDAGLLAVYRDYVEREPRLAAALVYAGERAWQRQCDRLARFIIAGVEGKDAA